MAHTSEKNQGISFCPVPELAYAGSGIGLRAAHHKDILEQKPDIGWLEAHSENYFGAGGPPISCLEQLRRDYPISLHGVGLSLGSAEGLNAEHLQKLKTLSDRIQPALISEHLSWSGTGGRFTPDLLPLPMTQEALDIIATNVDTAQEKLGRAILVENPSAYLSFREVEMTEPEFLSALAKRTGCGILLDVNNIYVSAHNTAAFSAAGYLSALPGHAIGEIHVAGHQVNTTEKETILIDAHNNPVCDDVWDLYEMALALFGDIPTLIEWDNDLPPLQRLVREARTADAIRARLRQEKRHVRFA